jgi:hypothetical protein
MSLNEESGQLEWRDTYFIFFQESKRPTLTQVEDVLGRASRRITLENLEADEDGLFQSILVQAPDDNAALEISYESGEAVVEQSAVLAKQLRKEVTAEQLKQLVRADARFDIMHFERVADDAFSEDEEDMLSEAMDPTSLLAVLEALSKLTGGMPIDPAAGPMFT